MRVVIEVNGRTVKLWQNLVRVEKRIGEINENTSLNKRVFGKFLQEYIDLRLAQELLVRLENARSMEKI